jgi:hypothetical protein
LEMASSRDKEVMIIELNNGLVFPAVEYIEEAVNRAVRHSKLLPALRLIEIAAANFSNV